MDPAGRENGWIDLLWLTAFEIQSGRTSPVYISVEPFHISLENKIFTFKADNCKNVFFKKWVFVLHSRVLVFNVGKINSYHEIVRNASKEDEGKMTLHTEGGAEKHPNHLN